MSLTTILRVLFVTALVVAAAAVPAGAFTLGEVEADVRANYPGVVHVGPEALARRDVIVFDVREDAEYHVSRLPGAIRIDPGMRPRAFMRRFAVAAAGKRAIFYCSVGVRSSIMADAVQDRLIKMGAVGVANLSGGIFRWHNERRKLVNAGGETDLIHPYNRRWGRLLTRQNKLIYRLNE